MKIEVLQLETDKLQEQRDFYGKLLELPVEDTSEDSFRVNVGYSILKFRRVEKATPYHIAFHISSGKEEDALDWLEERVSILKDEEDEIVNFPAWNAKSVYFYDAGKNVVEFISRRDYFFSEAKGFSGRDVVGISEIGLASTEVKSAFEFLNEELSLEKFTGDYETFCATGDDEGLFIVINKNKKDWFPSNDKAYASPFRISLSTAAGRAEVAYTNERLQLL